MYRLGLVIVAALAAACTAEVQTRPVPPPTVSATVAVEAPPPEQVGPPGEVTVQTAPPPVQVEVVPVAPSARHVWIAGHWHWNGVRWVWLRGRYTMGRVGMRWVPAHYANRGGAYVYIGGHWAR
jgi:hypothetical protein